MTKETLTILTIHGVISIHTIVKILQMQLPVAEDLLRNTENLAVVIGDVLQATSGNISNSSMTIIQENIGTYVAMLYNNTVELL